MNSVVSTTSAESLTILHVCSGDLWAGAERMICVLLEELRKDADKSLIALVLNEGTLSRTLQALGVETIVMPEDSHSFVALIRSAHRLLQGRNVHVIHSHGYKENVLSAFLAMKLGVRCLFSTMHGLPEAVRDQGLWKRQRKKLMKELNYGVLKRCFTGVAAVSQDIKNILVHQDGFSEAAVSVIHNGIEVSHWIDRLTHQSVGSGFHIGTVGRLVPVKRFDLFLKIAAEITKQSDDVRFSILGDGPLKDELSRSIRQLGLEDKVVLELPRADPSAYYRSLDVYLNTSLHEGIPLSILEAMVCKIPVVAPSVGGIPEIVSHGEQGYLVDTHHPSEFARYCLDLTQNRSLRTALGENAFKRVASSFSSSQMTSGYRKLYEAWNP